MRMLCDKRYNPLWAFSNILSAPIPIVQYDSFGLDTEHEEERIRSLRKEYKKLGQEDVDAKVLSYYYDGMDRMVESDKLYLEAKFTEAYDGYESASRLFSTCKHSRGAADILAIELDARISCCYAYMHCTRGLSTNIGHEKVEEFDKAQELFEKERQLVLKLGHKLRPIVIRARVEYAKGMYSKSIAEAKSASSSAAKHHLMLARRAFLKSAALHPFAEELLEETLTALEEVTKQRTISKAETLLTRSDALHDEGDYTDAAIYRVAAGKYYQRASQNTGDPQEQKLLLSMGRICEASALEAKGNDMFKRLNDASSASSIYLEASMTIERALALAGSARSTLAKSFGAQKTFYSGLHHETKGIGLFDREQFQEATKAFGEAKSAMEKALDEAKSSDNELLVTAVSSALMEIEGYIQMASSMS